MPRVHRYPAVAVIGIVGMVLYGSVALNKKNNQTRQQQLREIGDSFNLNAAEVMKIKHRIANHEVSIQAIRDSLWRDKEVKMALEKTGQLIKKNF